MTRRDIQESTRLRAWVKELDQVTCDRLQRCCVGDVDPTVINDMVVILAAQDAAFDNLCALERT